MPPGEACLFQYGQRGKYEGAEVEERLCVEESLPAGTILQVRVVLPCNLDESHDLIVVDAHGRVVDAALVELEPVVAAFTVWHHAKPITINAHAATCSESNSRCSIGRRCAIANRVEIPHIEA